MLSSIEVEPGDRGRGGEKTGKYTGGWNWTLTFLGWQISCPTSS